jgi:hypothetical protein
MDRGETRRREWEDSAAASNFSESSKTGLGTPAAAATTPEWAKAQSEQARSESAEEPVWTWTAATNPVSAMRKTQTSAAARYTPPLDRLLELNLIRMKNFR